MKNTWKIGSTILAAVVMTAAGVHAQDSKAREDSTITVTGCLQPAGADRSAVGTAGSSTTTATSSTAATATTGAAANAGDSRSFMLVNARVGNAPGGGSGVTTVAPAGSGTNDSAVRAGNTPPSPAIAGAVDKNGNSTRTAGMYMLRGDNPELPRHAGQEVELSGRLIADSAATGATGAATASAGAGSASATANMPQLEVRTIRMIASVCAAR